MKAAILAVSLLLSSCAATSLGKNPMGDENIRQLLVGSWVCAPEDKKCHPSRSIYHQDGSLEFVRYKSPRCEIPVNETRARWRIENRRLFIVVEESVGSILFQRGLTTESEIMAISKNKLTLKGHGQDLSYRIRSKRCVPVEGDGF